MFNTIKNAWRLVNAVAAVRTVNVTENVAKADDGPNTVRDVQFDMHLSSGEVAALFALKGWQAASAAGPAGIPDSHEIMAILWTISQKLFNGEEESYAYKNRLFAHNDCEFPGTTDLYLHIGSVENSLSEIYDDEESEDDHV